MKPELASFTDRREKAGFELGSNWAELDGCEFMIDKSINRLKYLLLAAGNLGLSRHQTLQLWTEEVRDDLRGFTQEYILQTPLTPVEYQGMLTDDVESFRLAANNFRYTRDRDNLSRYFWVREKINTVERSGAVLLGWQNLERLVAGAPVGSVVAMTSPDGPTGIAQTADYPYSRTYILEITEDIEENGQKFRLIKGYDVQSDLILAEHRQLLNQLLPQDRQLGTDTKEAEIAENPALLSAENGERKTVKDVLMIIEEIRKQQGRTTIYQGQCFSEIYQALDDEKLNYLDPIFQQPFNEFREVLMTKGVRPDVEIKQALALLVLATFSINRHKTMMNTVPERFIQETHMSTDHIIFYPSAYYDAQNTQGSCPRTVHADFKPPDLIEQIMAEFQQTIFGNPAIPGINGTNLLGKQDKYGALDFICPHCAKTVSRPYGKLKAKCPACDGEVKCG